MRKIIQVTKFRNLLTVEIEGPMMYNKIGDVIKDNHNNLFKITSVALISGSGVNRNNTTLVVEPLNDITMYGSVLNVK